jgi:TrmH family RNA methyltransferase
MGRACRRAHRGGPRERPSRAAPIGNARDPPGGHRRIGSDPGADVGVEPLDQAVEAVARQTSEGAADGDGEDDLDDLLDSGDLHRPTAWLFGSEAHGLDDELLAAADRRVRVPIYGGAESLNLAAAAAVCLYASARAQR